MRKGNQVREKIPIGEPVNRRHIAVDKFTRGKQIRLSIGGAYHADVVVYISDREAISLASALQKASYAITGDAI